MAIESVEDLFTKILGRSASGRAEPDVIKKILQNSQAQSLCSPLCYETCFALMMRAKSVQGAEFILDCMEGINATVKAEAQVALARLRAMAERPAQAIPLGDSDTNLESVVVPDQAALLAEFVISMIGRARMDDAVEAWLKMKRLHGNLCAQVQGLVQHACSTVL